jgi:hypothetical protein
VRYQAHGLTLASARPLPELLPVDSATEPDVLVSFDGRPLAGRFDRVPWFSSEQRCRDGRPELLAFRCDHGRWLEFAYADGTTFDIDAAGRRICVTASAALPFDGVCEYLLGPILGVVMRLRGMVCLHASAVRVAGGALAFMGAAGAGKSTLAAAFANAGIGVLSDDTVALAPAAGAWMATPAYPRVRLWPDAAAALRVPLQAAIAGTRHQLDLLPIDRYVTTPTPLAAIYAIEFDDTVDGVVMDTIGPAAALPLLSAHTFAHRVLTRELRMQEFHALADLADAVPVRRLRRPRNLEAIALVPDAILTDAA